MAQNIQGMTALITGAAKRVGRETALTLAGEGVNIVVHYDHSHDAADELVRELEGKGVRAWTVRADFKDQEEYGHLIDQTLEIAGTLDILINNASIFPKDTLENTTFQELVDDMEVNAWAPLVFMRAFVQRADHGKIVNLIDSRVHGYEWTHVAYIISKHALQVFTRMAALQYAPNFTVNAVAPGLILPPPGEPESYIEQMAHTVPLKRHGDPQYVADAITYLVKSEYVTGEMIYVDGGRHLWEYVPGPHPK